jgi:hypothetical protein
MPLPKGVPNEDPGLMLRVAQPARETVIRELTAKGLTETNADQADLEVNLRGQSLPRQEIVNSGYSYPAMTRYGMVTVVHNPYTSVSTFNERTLVIEMLDRRAKEVVWVGWLKKESSSQIKPEAFQEAIRKILEKFPPTTPST